MIPRLHTPGDARRRKRRLRYVQTLPTLCTLGNLLCGFGAIHLCLRAMWLAGDSSVPFEIIERTSPLVERLLPTHVVMAAYLIFVAMVLDALDGRLARLTRSTTDFGAQLDSLADVVSFGVAPALIVIALLTRQTHGPEPLVFAPFSAHWVGRVAWIMVAAYVACTALRLARFNVEATPDAQSHMSFRGLPSPGAAAALVALVILHDHVYFYNIQVKSGAKAVAEQGGVFSEIVLWSLPVLALITGLLMVSRFPYVHLANRYLRGQRSFAGIVKFLLVLAAVVAYPEAGLTLVVVGYALSGPAVVAFRAIVGGRSTPDDDDEDTEDIAAETDQEQTG